VCFYRSPALLAKMAVTAGGVSGGRLVLVLGAGWYDPEYLAFGFPASHWTICTRTYRHG
jgi:alkanesulfonate monooxygenase SsuD/methylene tetrahydromethanopterin reductase-like flavin-dependent oxidoreductase (luciferase family)